MALSGSMLLIVGILGASVVIALPGADDMEGPPAPPSPMALRKGRCIDDAQCDDNHYCFGKGPTKRCIPCFDCADAQRKPKQRTYDDSSVCHHHRNDCGDCNDGYEMNAGICIPVSTTSKTTITPNAPKVLSPQEFGKDVDVQKNASTSVITWTLAFIIMAFIGIASLVVLAATKGAQWWLKRGGRQNEEGGNRLIGDIGGSPSAPPPEDEYRNPPPSVPLPGPSFPRGEPRRSSFRGWNNQNQPKKVSSKKVMANPFQLGNGPSSVVEDDGDGVAMQMDDNAASSFDNVDVGGHIAEPQGTPIRLTGDMPGDGYPRGQPPRADNQTQQNQGTGPERRRRMRERSRRNSQPHVASTSGPPALPQGHGLRQPHHTPSPFGPQAHNQENIMMAHIAWNFRVGIWVNNHNNSDQPTTFNPTASSTPQRFVISAPPSPRRIDDTYMDPLNELPGPFQASQISLDSGTGTHERSMPSHSTSDNDVRRADFSDMDSMYGDPLSPAAADVSVVPEDDEQRVPALEE